MSGALSLRDFGHTINEATIKAALKKLQPRLQFDVAGRNNWSHKDMATRQGVYLDDKYVGALERGMVPEFHVWAMVKNEDGTRRLSHVVKVGWRHTFQSLVCKQVPNVTWTNLNRVLGVEYKDFIGDDDSPMLEID